MAGLMDYFGVDPIRIFGAKKSADPWNTVISAEKSPLTHDINGNVAGINSGAFGGVGEAAKNFGGAFGKAEASAAPAAPPAPPLAAEQDPTALQNAFKTITLRKDKDRLKSPDPTQLGWLPQQRTV